MKITKDLSELIDAGVISEETASKIAGFYEDKHVNSPSKLFLVFGILGAVFVGLGIILIIAHNWDQLPVATKTIFAFLPLICAQLLCFFVLVKRRENRNLRESSACFLFFAVAAAISLVSQIYHLPGDLSSFLLSWMLLCFPIIFIMRSSMVSLLYLMGISWYAIETGYWTYQAADSPLIYWLLLIPVLLHYYLLIQKFPVGNFTKIHHWFVSLSLIITLGTLAVAHSELMFIAYLSLFGLFYSLGNAAIFNEQKANSFTILGSFGTIVLLIYLSFNNFWNRLVDENFHNLISSPEFIAASLISILAFFTFLKYTKRDVFKYNKPIAPVFILFIFIFLLGVFTSVAVLLINFLVFAIGLLLVKNGTRQDHMGILNLGLLIISTLVICRFFDTDLSFVSRGAIFILVGTGFFLTNYQLLKKRKNNGKI